MALSLRFISRIHRSRSRTRREIERFGRNQEEFYDNLYMIKNKDHADRRTIFTMTMVGHKQRAKCKGLYQSWTEYIDAERKEMSSFNTIDLSKITLITLSLRSIVSKPANKRFRSGKTCCNPAEISLLGCLNERVTRLDTGLPSKSVDIRDGKEIVPIVTFCRAGHTHEASSLPIRTIIMASPRDLVIW